MICSLAIKIAHREGKSFLKDAYATQPFRIVPVGQYQKDNAAYLMIMSSSPGLLDGDDHRIQVDIAPGSKLQLQTQDITRLQGTSLTFLALLLLAVYLLTVNMLLLLF